jgi:hypothetical protein
MKKKETAQKLLKYLQDNGFSRSDGHDTYILFADEAEGIIDFLLNEGMCPKSRKITFSGTTDIYKWDENITEGEWSREIQRQNRE